MHNLRDKLTQVRDRVRAAAEQAQRDVDAIQLVAVSKTQPAAAIRAAYEAGQQAFGENYLQEALEKQAALADLAIEWHFIGPIQSNKTQAIARNFDWVHSVDRLKVARRLSEQRPAEAQPLNICLQVNIDNESSKSGVTATDLPALAETIGTLPHLRLRGLMVIPQPRENYREQVAVFEAVRDLLDNLRQRLPNQPLDTLSMGMSGDLEAAIAAGATLVRVGTDIFGERET